MPLWTERLAVAAIWTFVLVAATIGFHHSAGALPLAQAPQCPPVVTEPVAPPRDRDEA